MTTLTQDIQFEQIVILQSVTWCKQSFQTVTKPRHWCPVGYKLALSSTWGDGTQLLALRIGALSSVEASFVLLWQKRPLGRRPGERENGSARGVPERGKIFWTHYLGPALSLFPLFPASSPKPNLIQLISHRELLSRREALEPVFLGFTWRHKLCLN